LEIFSESCKTIGNNVQNRIDSKFSSNKINAIRRLHQKSTLVSSEIIYLIKGGYAAAALSRWRTLFETSSISILLALNDESLSKRYLDYAVIETKKEMDVYLRNYTSLGFEEISKDRQESIQTNYDNILKKHGKDFCEDYGWAGIVLSKKKSNLHDIIDHIGSQYMKPFYKLSNNYIHGGPKSLMYNLGYIDGVLGDNTISCQSNIGFTDPAQLCAISFFNSTLAFLSVNPNLEDFTVLLNLYYKINRIAKGFAKIEKEIEQDEKD
jgi:hypothetical protein